MPRVLIRPKQSEIDRMQQAFMDHDLKPVARRMLRAVLAWSKGKTIEEAAADPQNGCKRETVRKAVKLYREAGLKPFLDPSRGQSRPRGHPPIPAQEAAAIAEDLRRAFDSGDDVSYRSLAQKYKRSLGKIAAIAKEAKLDSRHRRGRVAPPGSA